LFGYNNSITSLIANILGGLAMVGNIATVVGFSALIFTLLLEKVGNSLTFRLFGVCYKSPN